MLSHVLDVALVLGIFINLVKAGDLFLRPHQQARVQSFFEDLTLRVEDVRPIEWLGRLATPRAHLVLVLIGVVEFLSVMAAVAGIPDSRGNALAPLGSNAFVFQVASIICSIPALALTAKRHGPPLVAWLLGPPPIQGIVRRFLKTLALGFLALALYEFILFGLVVLLWGWEPFDSLDLSFGRGGPGVLVIGVGLLLVWPAFVWFWVITQVGGLIIWAVIWVRLLEVILKVVRALCWRIVEYNKGAWAAVVLIITGILGLAKLVKTGSV